MLLLLLVLLLISSMCRFGCCERGDGMAARRLNPNNPIHNVL
jgi:hypothetical protein